ncbi:hypothetical protein KL904_005431, partial [Ogataea polymorpha]
TEIPGPQHVADVKSSHDRKSDIRGEKVRRLPIEEHSVTVGQSNDREKDQTSVSTSYLKLWSVGDTRVQIVVRNSFSVAQVGDGDENP